MGYKKMKKKCCTIPGIPPMFFPLGYVEDEKAGRKQEREKQREWEKQFPPLSCHPPYASPEELEKTEQLLEAHRRRDYAALQVR